MELYIPPRKYLRCNDLGSRACGETLPLDCVDKITPTWRNWSELALSANFGEEMRLSDFRKAGAHMRF